MCVLLAFGGNVSSSIGDPQSTIRAAMAALAERQVRVVRASRFFRTPCFPPGTGPDFVNAAARVEFDGDATDLLGICHAVEASFGRHRNLRWQARPIDIDILAAGDAVLPDRATFLHWQALDPTLQAERAPDRLILPHPRLQDRAFVLIPLAEVEPDWVHPVSGRSVAQMVAALPRAEKAQIWPLSAG